MQVRDRVSLGLEVSRRPGSAAGRLGPEGEGVVHIIFVEAGFFQLLRGEISGELVDDGADDLHVGQFFCTQRSIRNVPFPVSRDDYDTVGFPLHSFSTYERIKKYDENEDAGDVGKPYSIGGGGMEITITIYGIASTRFDMVG